MGFHVASMSCDMHVAKMLLFGTIFKCIDPILTIAAILSSKSPWVYPSSARAEADAAHATFNWGKSDHLSFLKSYNQWQDIKKKEKSEKGITKEEKDFCSKVIIHHLNILIIFQRCFYLDLH